ncbi:MAG TPA: hypothetical protein VMT36_05220 [Candidatus Saccharimonadia bacterium]|nr:hypothetical protein [Candidatus Saccharimonadia bacterium]
MTDKVASAYVPALTVIGAEADPVAHVVWGDDPDRRYVILAAADAGLVIVNVRVNVPQEGPRAAAKLVRWSRVQVGEVSVEAHHGRRHVTSQIESVVLQGTDEEADEIGGFVAHVLGRIDGRVVSPGHEPGSAATRGQDPSADDDVESNTRSVSSLVPIQLPASTDPV